MEKDVTFYSTGLKLFGTLYVPDDSGREKRPCSVLSRTARESQVILPTLPARLSCSCTAFVFDYRGFGESEGQKIA
jgi:hypothetical protein